MMERANLILLNPEFQDYMKRNEMAEVDRHFCHHDMVHFMDVARIGMIINLKENYGLPEDLIYGAALLHDIGRFVQYEDGTPHEVASAQIAPGILRTCGFSDLETGEIVEAISNHRNEMIRDEKSLRGLLYRADKLSRGCFFCKMEQQCNWKDGKKNLKITY